jgi:hypothetical protein
MKARIGTIGAVAVLLVNAGAMAQAPLGSEFTYQGQLKLSGQVLNDTADFVFTLWDADAGGNMIGPFVPVTNVSVVNGLFTVEIDFGVEAFNGENRWLEIAVRSPAGGGAFTTLSPRQPLTATPYSLQTRGIVVDDLGNVGIGTDLPQSNVDVHGQSDSVAANVIVRRGSRDSYLKLEGPQGAPFTSKLIVSDGAGTESTAISIVNQDGGAFTKNHVGIGTDRPTEALDVAGNVAADAFLGDGSALSGVSRVGSTVDLDNVALLRWDLLNRSFPVGNGPRGVAFDGANIWVANAGDNNVTKLRASDGANLGTFPVGNLPFGVAFDGANIWVTNSNSDSVTKLRASDGANLGTFPVGDGPRGVAFDGANIWVANAGDDNVTKLRASDGANLGTFPVGDAPDGVAFDGANIWVANFFDDNVTRMSLVK